MARLSPRPRKPSFAQAVADVRDSWGAIEEAKDHDSLARACWNWWWARQRLRDAILEPVESRAS